MTQVPVRARQTVWAVLLIVVAACRPEPEARAAPVLVPPAPAPDAWRPVIGEYFTGADTLSVLEDSGKMVLLRWGDRRYPVSLVEGQSVLIAPGGDTIELEMGDSGGPVTALIVGNDTARRLSTPAETGETFRITPVRPVDALRPEALAATPPDEEGEFLATDLVELVTLDSTIHLDIRYATDNNFMGAPFYPAARAFLQRPAAEAAVRAHRWLTTHGYGLLIHDGYRPWYVTKMFWDATPESLRVFVADPASGSRHNRGAAVDLSLYDLTTGEPVTMTGGYDEFSLRSYPDYPGGTTRQRWLRELLRRAMEAEGFAVYDAEWWHFDYGEWRRYRIGNDRDIFDTTRTR